MPAPETPVRGAKPAFQGGFRDAAADLAGDLPSHRAPRLLPDGAGAAHERHFGCPDGRSVSMSRYRIAWLPGDGVGKEVMEAARIVLDRVKLDAEYVHGDIGWDFWCSEGDAFPARTVELLKNVDAAMFGAITSKPVKAAEAELSPALKGKGLTYRSPIVRMRQLFDLYVCLRPCKAYASNPLNFKEGIDLVVFRENTEDLYAGVEFNTVPDLLRDTLAELSPSFKPFQNLASDQYAISCKINTRKGSERIVRAAFEFAKKFGRKKVTVVHKANVVRATDGMFLEIAKAVAKDYPGIAMDDANIDAITMWLLKNPFNYDVLVAPNLYGDIISDLCAQMVGGLGFGCSGNIGEKLAVFEPTHGSAPKYAGQYKVNPIATILAAKMMLDWLGETEMGARVEAAVAEVVREGKVRTYDMGGTATTLEMGEAIASRIPVPAGTR
jgi:3-isopropylmalate dehydrogenase